MWGASPPGPDDVAVITRDVILHADQRVSGLIIEDGGHLSFAPGASVTLQSTGNIVVRGRLTMRPHPSAVHRIAFLGVNEDAFVGGGMDVLESDVGLWVVGDGSIDLAGSPRRPWIRAAGDVPSGATEIEVAEDPDGWQAGDEIAITPTLPTTTDGHDDAYDVLTVSAIHGRTVTLSAPVDHAHPSASVARDRLLTAEILNLTRNVRIEGSPEGRAHVFIGSTRPQSVSQVSIRAVGPRHSGENGVTEAVLGRYGLHFHHAHEGSRGSLIEGVVVRECGNHAFVPHMSHGISIRDCIAHDVFDEAYWWDHNDATDELLLDRCVASRVQSDEPGRGYTLTGFLMGAGRGNAARDCVAVGVQGNATASGFAWAPLLGGDHPWTFEGCVSHNNRILGSYAWQNTPIQQVIRGFVAYHNGRSGILHGSYRNPYSYQDCVTYANRETELEVLAQAGGTSPDLVTFDGLKLDGAGLHDYDVTAGHHAAEPVMPVRFVGCEFRGFRKAGFAVGPNREGGYPDWFRLEDCVYGGNEFWLDSAAHPDSLVEVVDPQHQQITLRRYDQPGRFVAAWNASVS